MAFISSSNNHEFVEEFKLLVMQWWGWPEARQWWNDGIGTNGIREPKKLTRLRNGYPTTGAKGNRSVKSTNQ